MTSTYDPSSAINHFLLQSEIAAREISSMQSTAITAEQVREALVSACQVEQQVDLLPLALSSTRIVELLAHYDFEGLIPLAEIAFEESILPEGVPVRFVEAQAKHNNEIWRVHKNDADPFPSNPHAHNIGTGYKLHLGNGGLYRKRERIGTVEWKHLLSIREKLSGIKLPPLEQSHG